jgi:4a-hydroxytetrahydrobiopterin dehydratase
MPERLLSDEEIEERLKGSPWRREGDEIVRELKLGSFSEAIGLINRVAEEAEAHNHHPDILLHGYNNVRLTLSNHAAGGLTALDFQMAERFERLLG